MDDRNILRRCSSLRVVERQLGMLVTTAAMAQQGGRFPEPPPPPDRSTPVQAEQLHETWNDRVSQGPPVGAMPEFDGWSMGAAMPLPRSEHSVAEFGGKIRVLGGYPPGRLPSNLVQVYDPATSRWTLGPQLPQPIHRTHVAAVGGKLFMIGGESNGASTGRPRDLCCRHLVARPGAWRLGQASAHADGAQRRRKGGDRRQDLRRGQATSGWARG